MSGVVRRVVAVAAVVAAAVAGTAGVADAKVHGVSQAGCAHDPSRSGANQSGENSPDGPIPVTSSETGEEASDGRASAGSGGDGDRFCDTAAGEARGDK
jgi:hypothetical protein